MVPMTTLLNLFMWHARRAHNVERALRHEKNHTRITELKRDLDRHTGISHLIADAIDVRCAA